MVKISLPLTKKAVGRLKVGDEVLLSGTIYTARDKTHQRLVMAMEKGKSLPFDLKDAVIFYAGPTPTPPGKVIGSIGPTTSARMDSYTPLLLKKGLKGMVGKGMRGQEVKEAIQRNRAVYFIAVGGAAAYLSTFVKKAKVIAYKDLGPEAIYRLEVKDFPVIVALDSYGNDLFARKAPAR